MDQTKFGPVEGNCLTACLASIFEIPIEQVGLVDESEWFKKLTEWLHARYHMTVVIVSERPYFGAGNVYHLICGRSPRGLEHATVGLNGNIVHDPHPSRDGLVGDRREFWFFVPMEER